MLYYGPTPFSLKIASSHEGFELPFNASRLVQPFPQLTAKCPYTGRRLKLPFPVEDVDPNAWFLGPRQVLNPNGISNGLAVFAGSLYRPIYTVTDRDRSTDHVRYSVCKNRSHRI